MFDFSNVYITNHVRRVNHSDDVHDLGHQSKRHKPKVKSVVTRDRDAEQSQLAHADGEVNVALVRSTIYLFGIHKQARNDKTAADTKILRCVYDCNQDYLVSKVAADELKSWKETVDERADTLKTISEGLWVFADQKYVSF